MTHTMRRGVLRLTKELLARGRRLPVLIVWLRHVVKLWTWLWTCQSRRSHSPTLIAENIGLLHLIAVTWNESRRRLAVGMDICHTIGMGLPLQGCVWRLERSASGLGCLQIALHHDILLLHLHLVAQHLLLLHLVVVHVAHLRLVLIAFHAISFAFTIVFEPQCLN